MDGKIEAAPYATLSYCWGIEGNPLRTTRENIIDHRQRIAFSLLPMVWSLLLNMCRIETIWLTKYTITDTYGCRYSLSKSECSIPLDRCALYHTEWH